MPETFKRRRLPHYDVDRATYFITACLAGSIPASGVLNLRRQRETLRRLPCPADCPADEWSRRQQAKMFDLGEQWLDGQPAARWLEHRTCAEIVEAAILHHAETSCDVHAYVVMPSHIHLVFTVRPSGSLSSRTRRLAAQCCDRSAIMRSIKSYSGRMCNRVLGLATPFWQAESYDRVVRDESEFERCVQYVEFNPVKAGLCVRAEDWRFSSAHRCT
ncbi:MAG: transposase [Planctomycetia bacterium]